LTYAEFVSERWRTAEKYPELKNQAGSIKIKNVKCKSQNDNVKFKINPARYGERDTKILHFDF